VGFLSLIEENINAHQLEETHTVIKMGPSGFSNIAEQELAIIQQFADLFL